MKKPKLPSPLIAGAVITRRQVTLGLGHIASIEITYDGPSERVPDQGSDWPPEKDWPAAIVRVILPNRYNYVVHDDLICDAKVCLKPIYRVADTSEVWGNNYTNTTCSRTRRTAGASLRKLAADLLRETLKELRPIQAHLAAREARLKQREAMLQAGIYGVKALAVDKAQG